MVQSLSGAQAYLRAHCSGVHGSSLQKEGKLVGWLWKSVFKEVDAAAGSPQSLYSPLSPLQSWFFFDFFKEGLGGCCCFVGSLSPLPFLSLLPYHSACLSLSLFSRKAETFLQLSGFFPWRISLIAPPDWVSLAGWWHWLYSISILLPSWENVPFIPPFCLLFLLQLFYSFSGI